MAGTLKPISTSRGLSKRLLFVDDEEGIRTTLPAILERRGYQVRVENCLVPSRVGGCGHAFARSRAVDLLSDRGNDAASTRLAGLASGPLRSQYEQSCSYSPWTASLRINVNEASEGKLFNTAQF